jgi:hypothetical protein
MEKLESLQNELFENFKDNEISQLNKIIGGVSPDTWTNQGSDYVGGTGGNTNDWYDTPNHFSFKGAIMRGYVQQ